MAIASHIRQLETRHGELEAALDEVLNHPSADDSEIVQLKREKLRIKDKIAELMQEEEA